MLKVSNADMLVKCKVLKQIMISGEVKRPGDVVELKFSVAKMLESSGRVSLVKESSLEKPDPKHKPETVKPKVKVSKFESHKHDKSRR